MKWQYPSLQVSRCSAVQPHVQQIQLSQNCRHLQFKIIKVLSSADWRNNIKERDYGFGIKDEERQKKKRKYLQNPAAAISKSGTISAQRFCNKPAVYQNQDTCHCCIIKEPTTPRIYLVTKKVIFAPAAKSSKKR